MEKEHAIILSISAIVAFVFIILSGALHGSYWGLFCRTCLALMGVQCRHQEIQLTRVYIVIPYVCIPLTGVLFQAIAGDSDASSSWNQFGCFFEAFFWISMFGFPLVFFHVDAIDGSQLAWILTANILVVFTLIGIAKLNSE